MSLRERQQEMTRNAILDALGQVIAESGVIGISMQQVADRAGVSHRTLYNHFPTREALSDAFAEYVEQVLAQKGLTPPDTNLDLESLRRLPSETYELFVQHESHLRAYVMLMIGTRVAAGVARARTKRFEAAIAAACPGISKAGARLAAAAVRMFLSSTGWHLLTEHYGLSASEAARAASWACNALVGALEKGVFPKNKGVS
jgi:AcrR family transcriptional regulator